MANPVATTIRGLSIALLLAMVWGCEEGNAPGPKVGKTPSTLRYLSPCVDTSQCATRCTTDDPPSCGRYADMVDKNMGPAGEATQALKIFEIACNEGVASGCQQAGSSYRNGVGTERDEVKAVAFYQRSCEGGNAEACSHLSSFYEHGRGGLDEDAAKAIALMKKSCDAGYLNACVKISRRMATGRGIAMDPAGAATLVKETISRGEKMCSMDGRACVIAARLIKESGELRTNFTRVMALQQSGCDEGVIAACQDAAETLVAADVGYGRDLQRAQRLYEKVYHAAKKECEDGVLPSCFRQAQLTLRGDGVTKDPTQAAQLLQTTCGKGHPGACSALGRLYIEGVGVEKDPARAAQTLESSCMSLKVGFEVDTCVDAGRIYERGVDVPRDLARATKLYKVSCDLDASAPGCVALARAAAEGRGMERDLPLALTLRKKLCDKRDWAACVMVGRMIAHGEGTAKSGAQGLEYLNRACATAPAGEGCAEAGLMYEWGDETKVDKETARRLYGTACDKGNYLGCYYNGVFFRYSRDEDPAKAVPLFSKACEHGLADACSQLSMMYASSRGVTRDSKKAAALLLSACRSGSPSACVVGEGRQATLLAPDDATLVETYASSDKRCRELETEGDSKARNEGCLISGFLVEHGLGMEGGKLTKKERDLNRAREFYQMGCNHGDSTSCTVLGGLLNLPGQPAKDKERGRVYLQKNCHEHDVAACDKLKELDTPH